jgi:RNA polymerase sigma factor (sigma-70 family)
MPRPKAIDSNFRRVLYFARIFAVPESLGGAFFRMSPAWTLVEVWERYQSVLRRIPKSILIDHSLIDDVLQDAFANILSSERKWESEAEAYNYVRRAVINMTISYYRRLRKDYQGLRAAEFTDRDIRTPLAAMLDREDERAQLLLMAEVRTLIDGLKPNQKEALDLIFDRQQRVKEACLEAGIPYSTLRSRVVSAVDRIRRRLREKGLLSDASEVKQ